MTDAGDVDGDALRDLADKWRNGETAAGDDVDPAARSHLAACADVLEEAIGDE